MSKYTKSERLRLRNQNPEVNDLIDQAIEAPPAFVSIVVNPEVALWLSMAGAAHQMIGREYAAKLLTDIFYGRR